MKSNGIHDLCETNLGELPLSSSECCFLARGWRRASFMIRIFFFTLVLCFSNNIAGAKPIPGFSPFVP